LKTPLRPSPFDEKLAALLEKCNSIADIQQGMTLLDVHLMNLEKAKQPQVSARPLPAIPRLGGAGLLRGGLPDAPENSGSSDDVTAADGGVAPKFYKLSFPTFDGERDPLLWFNRCEQFFCGQGTPEKNKVWLASYHIT
jgi:hypothetical protein